jgi:hypothetical protein
MTYIEQSIKEAVEKGGWKLLPQAYGIAEGSDIPTAEIFLDPFFWQALGKARGWPPYSPTGYVDNYEDDLEDFSWKVYWHRLIDHLANGNDAESFFKELV